MAELLALTSPDQIIWADVSDTADSDYESLYGIPRGATLVRLDQEGVKASGLLSAPTPTTVWLDSHGLVRWSWAGVLSKAQMDELRILLTSEGKVANQAVAKASISPS